MWSHAPHYLFIKQGSAQNLNLTIPVEHADVLFIGF